MKALKGAMKYLDGLSNTQIETMMYYNSSIFKSYIDRRVPPPFKLYWRARAVFAMFGHRKDAKSGKLLFNANAWTKVKNVLAEMLKGNALDQSGVFLHATIRQ